MTHNFSGATKFNLDISRWNVTNVLFMKNTFEGARVFNIDLLELYVYNILVFDFMFFEAAIAGPFKTPQKLNPMYSSKLL